MDARKSKSIFSADRWGLLALAFCLLLTVPARAQFVAPGSTGNHFSGFDSSGNSGPTDTPTWDPMVPTYTPTPTFTYNPFATDTPTATPGSPTDTITPTYTATQTGTIFTSTPTWSATPNISRASLVVLPTAYTNGRYDWTGFNWDIDFTYYIGSIVSRDENPADNQPGLDSLEQINLVFLTNDLKISWLDDHEEVPGFATGLLTSFLAQVGSSDSTSQAQQSASFQVQGNVVGGLYGVFSKTVGKDTAVHFGYVLGLQSVMPDVFSENFGSLLAYYGPGLQQNIGENPDSLFYMGFNTYFLGRNWKFEIWKPADIYGQMTPSDFLVSNPILFNTLIDGLPLAFNLGYERWDTGFAVLGYVNFRIPLIPSDPPY